MIELREATVADRDALLELRARCFPDDDREKRDPRFWDWEFRDGRMFVACDADRVVAHLGFVAQRYVIDGVSAPVMLAVDAMTDPEFRGRGLFGRVAMFARERVGASVAWQIRTAVLGGMNGAGWERVSGARVLIKARVDGGGDAAGPAVGTTALRMADVARDFFKGTYVERSEAYLRWRYFENPLWVYDVRATDDAYLVTRKTTLKNVSTLAIVDVAWRRNASRDASALLREALASTKTTLAATLVTARHPALLWFVRHGFLPGPHRFNLLATGIAKQKWSLCWGDTDHL